MKFTTASPNNPSMSNGRPFVSLSPKMSSATYSEGFKAQYNSPKTIPAKGFVLPRSNNENLTMLTQLQKGEQSSLQPKSKVTKSSVLMIGASSPSQKVIGSSNYNSQTFGLKDDKKSPSFKGKAEGARTMSSTPKSSGMNKNPSEPLRPRDVSGFNSNQYVGKWKKLEISTEFNSSKTSYGSRAQTTKHTEVDDTTSMKTSITQQSLQAFPKSYLNKTESVNLNERTRQSRPLSSSDAQPKTKDATSGYQARSALFKENIKVDTTSQGERSSSIRNSAKKTHAGTPKVSQSLRNAEDSATIKKAQVDLRASWQAASQSNGTDSAKKRPSSAKKVSSREAKEEQGERTTSKDAKAPTQKVSLNSFVTQVNKGDPFGGAKKMPAQRENSAQKIPRKSYLTLEDKPSKPIKAVELDLRASQTTTNADSKTFTINLNRNIPQFQTSPSSVMSQKQQQAKQTKQGPGTPKQSVKNSQELVPKKQAQEPFIYYMTLMEKAHKWNPEVDYFVQVYREHFLQTYQALSFCKMLKPFDNSVINQKKSNLPRKDIHKNKKTLVFDMDETLIHCNESADMPADVILPIIFPNGEVVEAGINVRPYALEILKELSQYYEIVVFTASHACYANVVLDYLDPHEQYISHRLFRESCVVTDEGVHIKDLRVIGGRNMKDLILVDNAAYSFGFQIENGIPIIPFYDNKADQELRHLIPYLKFLSSVDDLREINKQTFKLHLYGHHDSPEAVLENVFA